MENKVCKIMLFTLSACPMGRSMGDVLSEVKNKFPQIQFETVYVEIMTEITNHYRIKKNPTTLFLDSQGSELYRIEGSIETDETIEIINKLNKNVLQSNKKYEENKEIVETYTIYLYKNEEIVPLEVQYKNSTSVRAPRITALNLLINSKIEGYENPFLPSTTLELVNFDQNRGEIIVHVDVEKVDEAAKSKMQCALVKTLSHFGIEDVELIIGGTR